MTRTDDEDIFEYPAGVLGGPVHPGRTLRAELQARDLTASQAAMKMRVPANRVTEIVAGRRDISADTALRLARLFGTSALFWLNLQAQHDLAVTERDHGQRIATEVEAA
jgi:antitoxin HigA-1